MSNEAIVAVVLAGGKGVRMQSELPKVLHPLQGKPLIAHVLDSLGRAGVNDIIVVVGYRGEDVMSAVTGRARTVWQRQQLGTGHAVMQAEEELAGFKGKVLIACGDVPLLKPETFRAMIEASREEGVKAVLLTMDCRNPAGYGRIVKDDKGEFLRIVEEKDASLQEKLIKEVNTGTYVFERDYLFEGLSRLDRNNAQGEYYLTDALQYVLASGYRVRTIMLEDSTEGTGINSKDELGRLEQYLKGDSK